MVLFSSLFFRLFFLLGFMGASCQSMDTLEVSVEKIHECNQLAENLQFFQNAQADHDTYLKFYSEYARILLNSPLKNSVKEKITHMVKLSSLFIINQQQTSPYLKFLTINILHDIDLYEERQKNPDQSPDIVLESKAYREINQRTIDQLLEINLPQERFIEREYIIHLMDPDFIMPPPASSSNLSSEIKILHH